MTKLSTSKTTGARRTGHPRPGPLLGGRAVDLALDNVVWLLIIVVCVAAGLRSPFFLSVANLQNVLVQGTPLGILVLSVSAALLLGEIDLSFVGNLVFSATIGAVLIRDVHLPGGLAICVVLIIGTLVGLVNGYFIAILRMNSLIETLAMGLLLQGVVLAITKGQTLAISSASFGYLGSAQFGGWPLLPLTLVLFYVAAYVLLSRTAWGRKLYAIGGNPTAALAAGIQVRRMRVSAYALGGLLGGCASYCLSSYLSSINVNAGSDLLLYAVAAPVIGGVSLKGGRGRVIGMLGGAMLLTVVQAGLQIVNISSYYVQVVGGAMILIAVGIDAFRVRREEQAGRG